MQSAFAVHNLKRIVTAVASQSLDDLAVRQGHGHRFIAQKGQILGRLKHRLLDDAERTGAADVRQIRPHAPPLAANRVAIRAARFAAPENLLPGLGISGHFVLAGRAADGMNKGHELPRLVVVQLGGRHVGAGQPISNRVEDTLIAQRMPHGALHQVGPAPSAAVRPMATGARSGV